MSADSSKLMCEDNFHGLATRKILNESNNLKKESCLLWSTTACRMEYDAALYVAIAYKFPHWRIVFTSPEGK